MTVPHYIFWPFDIGTSRLDRERTRAKTHIADAIRIGVLAQDEGAAFVQRYSCLETCNALFRHLEEGRPLAGRGIVVPDGPSGPAR